MKRLALVLLLLLLATPAFAQVTTVIIVRHGEKAGPSGDVPLSDAGKARAVELARVVGSAGITSIYVSQWIRTQQTAEPLAAALKLAPVVVQTSDTYAKETAERVMKGGGTALVVSHSDRIGPILKVLGIADPPPISDKQYDDLFIVTMAAGAPAKLTALRYGAVAR